MSQEAKVIRVRPGTTVKPTEIADGTIYGSLHDAILKQAEIPDGLDPWIEVDGIFFGPDQIRVMKRDLSWTPCLQQMENIMDEDAPYSIRLRAYELWEQAGRPHGKHLDFWTQAEEEAKGQPAAAAALDKEQADTFPARDPASSTMRAPKGD